MSETLGLFLILYIYTHTHIHTVFTTYATINLQNSLHWQIIIIFNSFILLSSSVPLSSFSSWESFSLNFHRMYVSARESVDLIQFSTGRLGQHTISRDFHWYRVFRPPSTPQPIQIHVWTNQILSNTRHHNNNHHHHYYLSLTYLVQCEKRQVLSSNSIKQFVGV